MMRAWPRLTLSVVATIWLGAIDRSQAGQTPAPFFDFHSAFWINLHHYVQALGRHNQPLQDDLAITTTGAERESWRDVVASYRRRYGNLTLFDGTMTALKAQLLALSSADSVRGATVSAEDARALETAAPIYRRHVWPAHDAANRRFIASVEPMLAQYGQALASRIARSYDATWPVPALRTDVVHAIDPESAAYTTNTPRTHITIEASDPRNGGLTGLEMLFHEASHGWGLQLRRELEEAAVSLNADVPGELQHAVLTYNAGELTRRVLAEAGLQYRLYMDVQRLFPDVRPAIAAHWPQFLDGTITRREALRRIVRALTSR